MTTTSILCRASHLFLGDRVVDNGAVEIHRGRVVWAGEYSRRPQSNAASTEVRDLGDGMILPGLVNAHTHLEFSQLDAPLGHRGIEFTQWIRLIVAERMSKNADNDKRFAISSGLQQCFGSGSWLIGEIATSPCSLEDYRFGVSKSESVQTDKVALPESIVFLEQLGRSLEVLEPRKSELDSFLRSGLDNRILNPRPGTSPHAPYSVGTPLLKQMIASTVAISDECQQEIPIAMHVAETQQERELLEQGRGPFVDLLKDFGVWDPATFDPPCSIKAILESLACNRRSLVVHGNYLTESEMDFIANCSGMSVVYCPRTHSFFDHVPYPLHSLLQRGINVAIGTDSRASNPDLDLHEELKHIARGYPELDVIALLKLGTVNGATALGVSAKGFGSLAVGQKARMSFIGCPSGMEGEALSAWLWHDESHCKPVLFG